MKLRNDLVGTMILQLSVYSFVEVLSQPCKWLLPSRSDFVCKLSTELYHDMLMRRSISFRFVLFHVVSFFRTVLLSAVPGPGISLWILDLDLESPSRCIIVQEFS